MIESEGLAEPIPVAEPPPVRIKRKYKKRNEVKPEDEPSHLAVFLDTEYGEQGWVL